METTHITDWVDPLNMLLWKKAFSQRAKRVTLRDGREFTIEYSTRVNKIEGKKYDVAYAKPASDSKIKHGSLFVPCGWFSV